MHTHADKTPVTKNQSVANEKALQPSREKAPFHFVDNRPEAVTQRKLQAVADNSPQVNHITSLHSIANQHTIQQQMPIQRIVKNAAVAWSITHIVEQTGDSLFGDKTALANELNPRDGGQLKKGDKLIIDDAPVIISRRGSNQENKPKRAEDEKGNKVYEWVQVLKIIPQDGPEIEFSKGKRMYIRKETITIEKREDEERPGARNEIELQNIKDWDKEQIPGELGGISDKWRKQGALTRTKSKGVIDIDKMDMAPKKDGGREKPSGRYWDQYDEGVNVADDMASEEHEPFEPTKRQWRIKAVEKNSGVLVGVLIVEERKGDSLYLRWMIGNPEIRGGGSALLSAVKILLNKPDTENSIEVTSAYSAKDAYTKAGFKEEGDGMVRPGEEFTLTLSNEGRIGAIPKDYQDFEPEPYINK
jgi:hypothetical protein